MPTYAFLLILHRLNCTRRLQFFLANLVSAKVFENIAVYGMYMFANLHPNIMIIYHYHVLIIQLLL